MGLNVLNVLAAQHDNGWENVSKEGGLEFFEMGVIYSRKRRNQLSNQFHHLVLVFHRLLLSCMIKSIKLVCLAISPVYVCMQICFIFD